MKYMVISDIHGSNYYLEKALKIFKEENCDKLICLGDFFYHGPRNPLPEGYDIPKCLENLGTFLDLLIGIRGNCDAVIDEELLGIKLHDFYTIEDGSNKYLLTHGHLIDENNIPSEYDGYNILIGHYHKQKNYIINNHRILSPGSISLPKCSHKHGYMIIENGEYRIYDLLTKQDITEDELCLTKN